MELRELGLEGVEWIHLARIPLLLCYDVMSSAASRFLMVFIGKENENTKRDAIFRERDG
jgi:hypothetical protein